MKKLFIGTLFISHACLGFSQSPHSTMEEVKLAPITISPLSFDYLDKVQKGQVSDRVFTLEKKISRYDIKASPFFKPWGSSKILLPKRRGRSLLPTTATEKLYLPAKDTPT